jgi:hypothetical protein
MDMQEMIDRNAILDTINNYAFGVDLRDWGLFRSVFTDEIEADIRIGDSNGPGATTADAWTEIVRNGLSGYKGTHHMFSNFRINLDGDRASTIVYFQATHYLPNDQGDNHWTLAGYYNHDLVRTNLGWKIRKYTLNTVWTEGNRAVATLAAEQWQASQAQSSKQA